MQNGYCAAQLLTYIKCQQFLPLKDASTKPTAKTDEINDFRKV